MSEDIVKFTISESELDDLIYGLKSVHSKISAEDRVDVTIDFNKGKIDAYIQPRGDYKIEVEF